MATEVDRVIGWMEEARQSHQAWVDHLRAGHNPILGARMSIVEETKWVHRYVRTIDLLRKLADRGH